MNEILHLLMEKYIHNPYITYKHLKIPWTIKLQKSLLVFYPSHTKVAFRKILAHKKYPCDGVHDIVSFGEVMTTDIDD